MLLTVCVRGGVKLLYWGQRGEPTTLILHQGATVGADVRISRFLLIKYFQLGPAEGYLKVRINVLNRVPFYCKEERMVTGKFFLSVLL